MWNGTFRLHEGRCRMQVGPILSTHTQSHIRILGTNAKTQIAPPKAISAAAWSNAGRRKGDSDSAKMPRVRNEDT